MCQIFATTDPILYESRSRSVRVHGTITGIRLENLFWELLADMAGSEGLTTNQLIVKLHEEVSRHRGEVTNFTSFLRVTCLRYQSLQAQAHKIQDSKQSKTSLDERRITANDSGAVFDLERFSQLRGKSGASTRQPQVR